VRSRGRHGARTGVGLLGVGLLVAAGACSEGEPSGSGEGAPASGARAASSPGAGADSARVAREVREMLTASAGSWNGGDLDGFLEDYVDEPPLVFVGSGGVIRGVDALRARYRASYWSEGGPRDSLRFEEVEVRPLGERHAVALGRYVLHRPEEEGRTTGTGYFTLVLREEHGGRWRILHDHSSAAETGGEGGDEGAGEGEASSGSPEGGAP